MGDAPTGAIPLGRVATIRGSLRRHAYTATVKAMMSRGKSNAKPAELSQLHRNAAGIDVGATSHFVAVPADRAEQPVQEFEAFTTDLYRLADWLGSAAWRPWSWSPLAFTGYHCSGCWKSVGLR